MGEQTNNAGTEWTLYAENDEAWNSILADCANAKESIVLEQFIFVKDEFGNKLIDICAERALQGVKVRFLWDAAGSFTFFGTNISEELERRGIEVVFWKTLIPSYFKVPDFRSWYLRNHRRTLVIDDKIGYTGSICVMDRMKNWRDTNVRLEGPVVKEMRNAFERMWARANKQKFISERTRARDPEFKYITNYPAPGRRHLHTMIIEALRNAKNYVYITTPYFVPTHRMARVLALAAQRGVDVRIIIPEKSDYYAVDLGARSYFSLLLRAGARIFLYSGNMIHSKSIIVDGTWATVGSLNLDSASLLYNFEANIITTNSKFAEELSSHFVNDLKDVTEVKKEDWFNRFFVERIPEQLIKLVRKFL